MKLQRFEVESYMTLHENNCRYNLADTCAKPLTLKELLAFEKKDSLGDLMNLSLDYGVIEGSHALKKGILDLYQSGDDEEIAICHGGVNANELVLMTLLSANDHILSFLPTYQQLYSFPESLGVEVDFIHLKEENDWLPDLDDFKRAIKDNTKMICLVNPNNPTSTMFSKEFLLKLTVNPDCYTFVVMTSNNGKSGNSFVSLSQALSRSGANLSAVFDLQMPGNCLISSEQENLERLKKAPERLKSIISFIKERKTNFTSDGSLPKEDFVTASYFYGGHSCAACYACLHWCPKNATLLKVPFLKHRPQYHHPDVTLAEIKE